MFIFYNPNPDKTLVGDCVVRGIKTYGRFFIRERPIFYGGI